jgi:Kef-type K+ transport system membrane component KefB
VIEPIQSVLLVMFFLSIGLLIDLDLHSRDHLRWSFSPRRFS